MSAPSRVEAPARGWNWRRWLSRLRRRGDRGAVATRVASGVSALVVMGTVGYVATDGCGVPGPFGPDGDGSTINTASTVSFGSGSRAIAPTVSSGGTATIDAHGEGGRSTKSVVLDIPQDILEIYQAAGEAYDIPWEYVAALGSLETSHGTWNDGAAFQRGERNHAGAAGLLQMGVADLDGGNVGAAANAWGGKPVERVEDRARHYEVGEVPDRDGIWDYFGIDGNGDGWVDVWDPWDNVFSGVFKLAYFRNLAQNHPNSTAASDCRSNGQSDPLDCAIYRHNPANWYVQQARDLAGLYAESDEFGVSPSLNVAPASYTTAGNGQVCTNVTNASAMAPWGSSGSVGEAHRTAVEFVIAQVGKGYSQAARWGPDSYDCSSLVHLAWREAGISIPQVTWTQWDLNDPLYAGTNAQLVMEGQLRVDALQPGDLVYFHTIPSQPSPSHVGMYIGNGEMVDAGNPSVGVRRGPIDTDYWRSTFVGVIRIFTETDVVRV